MSEGGSLPRSARTGLLLPALLAAGLAAGAALPAAAQKAEPGTAGGPGQEEAEMARAPTSFRVGPTAGWTTWEERTGTATLEAGPMFGLDLERLLAPFLSARLGLSVGGTSSTPPAGGGGTDVVQYALDLSLTGRFPIGALGAAGVVPFATAGLGSVVHDPAADSLVTKSQGAVTYGAGVELDLRFLTASGLRVEWRRSEVEFEGVHDPTNREGRERAVDRFLASVYWEL